MESSRATPTSNSSKTEKLWEAHEQVRALLPLQEHNARLATEVELLKKRLRAQQEDNNGSSSSFQRQLSGNNSNSIGGVGQQQRYHQQSSASSFHQGVRGFGAVPDINVQNTSNSTLGGSGGGANSSLLQPPNQSYIPHSGSPNRSTSFATRHLSPHRNADQNSTIMGGNGGATPLASKVIEATSTQLSFNDQLHQYKSRGLLIEKQMQEKDELILQLQAELRKAHDTTLAVSTQFELEGTMAKQRFETELAVEKARLYDARKSLETTEKMLAQVTEEYGKVKGELQQMRSEKDAAERRQMAAEQSLTQQREELEKLRREVVTLRHDNGMLEAVQQECDLLRDAREAAKIQRRELEASEEELNKERSKRREADKKALELDQQLNESEMFRRKAESDLRVASVEAAERASLRRELEEMLEEKRLCEIQKEDAEQHLKRMRMMHEDDISAADRLMANLSTQLMKLRQDAQNCFHDAEVSAQRKLAMAAVEFADNNNNNDSSVSDSQNAYAASRIDLMPKSVIDRPSSSSFAHNHLNDSRPGTPLAHHRGGSSNTGVGGQVRSPNRIPVSTSAAGSSSRMAPTPSSSSIDYTQSRVRQQQQSTSANSNSVFTGGVPNELQPAFSAIRSLFTDVIDAYFRERGDNNARLRHEATTAKETNRKLEEVIKSINSELNNRQIDVANLKSRLESAEHNSGSSRSNERFLRELVWSNMSHLFSTALSNFDERGAEVGDVGKSMLEDDVVPRWISIINMTSKDAPSSSATTTSQQLQTSISNTSRLLHVDTEAADRRDRMIGGLLLPPDDCHTRFTDKTWRYLWDHFSTKINMVCEGGGSFRKDNAVLNDTVRELSLRLRGDRGKAEESSRRQTAVHEEEIDRLQTQHEDEIRRLRKIIEKNKLAEVDKDAALRELEAANTALKHVKDMYNTLKDETSQLEMHTAALNTNQSQTIQQNQELENQVERLQEKFTSSEVARAEAVLEAQQEKDATNSLIDGADVLIRYLHVCGFKIHTLISERNLMMQRCHGLEAALMLLQHQALSISNAQIFTHSGNNNKLPLMSPSAEASSLTSNPNKNNNRQLSTVIATSSNHEGEATTSPPHQPLIRHRVVSSARVLAIAIMAVRRLRLFSAVSRVKREGEGVSGSTPTKTSSYNMGSLPDARRLPTTTELAIPPARELLASISTCASKQEFLSRILQHTTTSANTNGGHWWEDEVNGALICTLAPHIGGPIASNKRPWQQPISTIVSELKKSLEHGSTLDKLGRSFEDGLPSRRFFRAPWHRSLALRYPRGQLVSCRGINTHVAAIGGSETGLLMTIVGGCSTPASGALTTISPNNIKGVFDPLFTLLTIHTLNSSSVALSSFKATTSAQQAANALREARAERKIAADLMDSSVAMQNDLAQFRSDTESGVLVAGVKLQAVTDELERLRAALQREEETRVEYDRRFAAMRTREVELLAAQSDIRNEARSLALEIVAMQEVGLVATPSAVGRYADGSGFETSARVRSILASTTSLTQQQHQPKISGSHSSYSHTPQKEHISYHNHPSSIAYLSPQAVPTYAEHSSTAVSTTSPPRDDSRGSQSRVPASSQQRNEAATASSTAARGGSLLHATSSSSTGLNVSQGSSLPAAPNTTSTSSRRQPIPKVVTRPPSAHQSRVDSRVGITTTATGSGGALGGSIYDIANIYEPPISSPSTPSSTTSDEECGTPTHRHHHPTEEAPRRVDASGSFSAGGGHNPVVGTLSAIEMNSGGMSRVPSSLRGDDDGRSDNDEDIDYPHHHRDVKNLHRFEAPTTTTQRSASTTSSSSARAVVSGTTTKQSREDLLRLIDGIDKRIQTALAPSK